MNLRDLKNVWTICDAKSLSRAAGRLCTTQPSLSRTVRALEAEFGLPLFRRTGRGVEPTEAGLIVREHADRILQELRDLKAQLDKLQSTHRGEVTVLIPHYVSKVLVPPIIKRFSNQFPRASVHIFEDAAAEIPQRLMEGAADLGIFYPVDAPMKLAAEIVARERMYLVGLPDMISADHESIAFEEAAEMPLILSSRHTPYRRYVERFAAASGKRLRVVRELEVSYTQLAFVFEGEGATILPLSHCYEEIAGGLLVGRLIDRPVMYRQILMAFGNRSSGHLVASAARLFKEIIASHGAICGWHSVQSETDG